MTSPTPSTSTGSTSRTRRSSRCSRCFTDRAAGGDRRARAAGGRGAVPARRPSGPWPPTSRRSCTAPSATAAVQAASEALFGKGDLAALDAADARRRDGRAARCRRWRRGPRSSTPSWPSGSSTRATRPAGRSARAGPRSTTPSSTDPEQVLAEDDFLHGRVALLRRGRKSLAACTPRLRLSAPVQGPVSQHGSGPFCVRRALTRICVSRAQSVNVLFVSPTGRNGRHEVEAKAPPKQAGPGADTTTGTARSGSCRNWRPRQWVELASHSNRRPQSGFGSGRGAGKFEGLPRAPAAQRGNGARPILENSTACQKSMPITSSRGGFLLWSFGWVGVASDELSFG